MSQPSPLPESSLLAAAALEALANGTPLRWELPQGGTLRLDKQMPILCVFRRISDRLPGLAERLARAEAAHAVIPVDGRHSGPAVHAFRTVVEQLAHHFGTFLVIEIWSPPASDTKPLPHPGVDSELPEPTFEILAPASRIPRATVEAIAKSLGRDSLPYGGARIVLDQYSNVAPPGMKPLLRLNEVKKWNCYTLGLVVRPVDHGEASQGSACDHMRTIARSVHGALDHGYFTFVQQRKSLRPTHYHAPERSDVVDAVLDIDRQLAAIDRSFDLLLQATPVNAESAWREFRRSRFEKPPVFYYRPLAIDPTLLKRQLYLIPVERIDDPTLSYLFRQKQDELDRQITLLTDVDTPRFLPESVQIYGGVSNWLLEHAQEVLQRVPSRTGRGSLQGSLTATEFAQRAQQELGYYQQQCDNFAASVAVRDDFFSGMMVSGKQLLIGGRTRIARRRVDALLQHEIGTHLVTRYNGSQQPFQQLEVGLAGYDGLQEGLAVLAEYLVGGLSRNRMRILAARVVAAHNLLDGAPFVDTFRMLNRSLLFAQRTAYTIAMRVYRGGGLTKDAVYLRGLLQILRYLREGGELATLFIGKVASAHLPLISELSARGIIKPPALQPRYLERPDAQTRMDRLRAGMTPLDLVQ